MIQRIKRLVDEYNYELFIRLGLVKVDLKNLKNKVIILNYHGIDVKADKRFNSKFITKEYFRKQLLYFKENFNLISIEDCFSENISDKFNICITFDDGFLNNYKYVYPLIKELNVPCAFFITTIRKYGYDCLWPDHIDLSCSNFFEDIVVEKEKFVKNAKGQYISQTTQINLKDTCKNKSFSWIKKCLDELPSDFKYLKELEDYWCLLKEEDIIEMDKSPYITIGAHGEFHDSLSKISYEKACSQIQNSKSYLEDLLGHPITSFAYPDGSYTKELIQYAKKIGFHQQLAVEYIDSDDSKIDFLKERLPVNPYCSWNNQLKYILKGSYY